jgi:hypothetical protein
VRMLTLVVRPELLGGPIVTEAERLVGFMRNVRRTRTCFSRYGRLGPAIREAGKPSTRPRGGHYLHFVPRIVERPVFQDVRLDTFQNVKGAPPYAALSRLIAACCNLDIRER